MKRLIMICVIFATPMFQASNIYGQLDSDGIPEESDSVQLVSESSTLDNDLHEINLDTIDIDGSGNWLNKRIIYQEAQAIFDNILAAVSKVVDMRMQFSNEVNAIGRKIDEFYETVEFDNGQLNDKFKEILADLEVEQKLKGDLSEKERNLQLAIKQQMASITQLGQNIKSIGDVDAKIEQTLMQAFKTIDECRDYEAKSWVTFKAIGKEIDDKKARNLYYQMNNFKQNIDLKSNYLSASLLPYLHNILVAKIESNIAKINEAIEQLKQKGIDLSVIMKAEQEADIFELKEREKESNALAVQKALELELEKEAQERKRQALALKKKQEATWSYTMYRYYDIGKQALASYKYPVASYIYKQWMVFRGFMHSSVEGLMNYFHMSSNKKNKSLKNDTFVQHAEEAVAHTIVPVIGQQVVTSAHESDGAHA